jgi:hypothetical protein
LISESTNHLKAIDPRDLLTSGRLDIAVKLVFLHANLAVGGYAHALYRAHLEAFGFGQIREPGNQGKNSLDAFVQDFRKIASDIRTDTFDFEISPIPISKSGSITNGSHRTASAIFANKSVLTVDVVDDEHIYDYKFFQNRGMSQDALDYVSLMYLKYALMPRVALIWPRGNSYKMDEHKFFNNIIYTKEIKLNTQLLEELVLIAYAGEDWLGARNCRNRGFEHKARLVDHKCNTMRIVFFDASLDVEVIEQKNRFRGFTTANKHAIHITDNKDETLRLAQILLNENTLNFLRTRKLNATPNFNKLLGLYIKENINKKDYIVVGSGPLAAFGLRDCSDIDYLTISNNLNLSEKKINSHNSELQWYTKNIAVMIEDPKNYFIYEGIKFANIELVRQMKQNRLEKKDRNDLKLIGSLQTQRDKYSKNIVKKFRIKLYFFTMRIVYKFRPYIFYFLKCLRIYNTMRRVYRLLKNNKK